MEPSQRVGPQAFGPGNRANGNGGASGHPTRARAELTRLSADWLRFAVTSTHYLDPERLTKEIPA